MASTGTGLPENLRELDDAASTRKLVYGNTLSALQARFPVEDNDYRLELLDARYDGPQEYGLQKQKQALLRNRNLRTPIKGTWRLTDKRTGQVLDEREDTVMQVPYYTDRGTIIDNGSEYTVISQSRLRPGVYARRKSNGELETQFNIRPGTGRGFRLGIAPETGVMTIRTGQGQIPLYQVLKGFGVDDKEIARYWGPDVALENSKKVDPTAWGKLYARMAGRNANPQAPEEEKIRFVKEAVGKYEVDPEVVERTMGLRNCSTVTPELLLRASQKMLGLSRGDEEPDNRDNPRFSKFYGVEDYFKERIEKDAGRLAKSLLFKARRNRNLKSIQRNALNPWIDTVLQGSGLAMPGEEANPLSTLEQMSRISKFGMGGIASPEAVTMEARDVQGDYLGFVDPIAGPECLKGDAEVHTSLGWKRFDEIDFSGMFACFDGDKVLFSKAEYLVNEEYEGKMYHIVFDGGEIDLTPGHRMRVRVDGKWKFMRAYEVFNAYSSMEFGEEPYFVSTCPLLPDGGSVAAIMNIFPVSFKGRVYCATVPGGMLYVRNGGFAHWTGNSEKIGVDVRASYRTFKGKDNKLYGEFIDNRTGKKAYVDIATASDRLVAFPGQDMTQPYVIAMKDGIPQRVKTSDVRYTVPSFAHMMGSNTNMNPMPTAVQAGRQFYASKFWSQYLPQKNGQVPLVDSLMDDGKTTWSEYYGRKVGTLKSDVGGSVVKVDDDEITVKGDDGKLHKTELVKALPFNRLSAISYFPSVQKGQRVKAGDMLAHSNFTDAKTGAINMGQNLHVAIVPARGWTYEDAHIISESAAKRLATDRLYSFDHDAKNGVVIDKKKYMSAFPSKFTKEQMETLDDNGIVKPGTVLHRGDPIVASIGPKLLTSSDKALGKLSKALRNSFTDRSETWDHDYEGTVVDAVQTPSGAKVNVSACPPVRVGDKLCGRFGLKGVVGKVLEDDKMPRDAVTNQPYDMLVNPMGFLSRVAPGQLMEIALGKVAKATGRQIRIPQLPPPEGWYRWTTDQLKANNVSETSDLFDPAVSKTIKGVGDGYMFVSAFHHLAEKKLSARGGSDGAFTQDEQPAKGGEEGGKRSSGLDLWAMLSHNVPEVIKDIQLVRGTRNDDYWKALQLGLPIPEPDEPFIYRKFLNTLKAGGVNVTEKGSIVSIMPQTDKDVEKLAQGRVIDSSEMVDSDFEPVKGGLFDLGKTGGMAGNQWAMIKLPEPVPNPIMEEPVRRVLGLTVKELEDVLSGREKLNGKTGGSAIKDALSKIDVDARIEECKNDLHRKKGAARDNAVKQLRYLSSMKKQGLSPADWMVSKVPVIPPAFRPVSKMGDVALVSDMNRLYKDVIENCRNFSLLKGDMDDAGLADERLNIYESVKAAYGLGQPITPENAAKGVKGALRQVMGSRPKFGLYQSKVLSKPVGGVSRGVVTPDPNLDMDQVGIPGDMAWKMYKPYVMRALVQHGYPATQAIKMIADEDETARHILEDEMTRRPVIMDRAPTWHKFNFMAFKPHLTDGKTIKVCPLITSGFTMDFDGDMQIGSVLISLKNKAFHEFSKGRENACINLITLLNYAATNKEGVARMHKDKKVAARRGGVSFIVSLEDFPHGNLSSVRKDDKYDIEFYEVPGGTEVVSYDEATGLPKYMPVRYWSIHKGKKLEIVNLDDGRQILSDNDPRAVYGIPRDGEDLTPGRFTPSDAMDRGVLVPVVDSPLASDVDGLFYSILDGKIHEERDEYSVPIDFDFGQFVGVMAGDGWSDKHSVVFMADNEGDNVGFVYRYLKGSVYPEMHTTEYVQLKENEAGRYGDTKRYRLNAGTLDFGHRIKELVDGHGDETTSGSANKRLPEWYQFAGRDFILGVVNGLVATDGTVTVSNAKGKPQLMVAFSSTSFRLVREFKRCCQLLGVGATITFSKRTSGGNSSWICSVSTVDAKRVGLLDRCCNVRKRDLFKSVDVKSGAQYVKNDILPFPGGVSDRIVPLVPAIKSWPEALSLALNTRARANEGVITRDLVRRLVALGDEIARIHTECFSVCSSVLAGIESRFEPMLEKDDGGSRRSWKVPVSLDEVKAMSLGLESVKPRFCDTWQKDVLHAVVAFTQIRKKGFMTWGQLEVVKGTIGGFGGPNTELRDSEDLKALSRMEKSDVSWVRVKSVEKTGKVEVGYDLTVPGTETFLSDDGIVLSNTVNVHVPSSDRAVEQALEKMLPSRNLTSMTDLRSPRHTPSKEQIIGLYNLTKGFSRKPVKRYPSVDAAKEAYRNGEIGPNDPIEIGR